MGLANDALRGCFAIQVTDVLRLCRGHVRDHGKFEGFVCPRISIYDAFQYRWRIAAENCFESAADHSCLLLVCCATIGGCLFAVRHFIVSQDLGDAKPVIGEPAPVFLDRP